MDNVNDILQYLVNPTHPVSIALIGAGATGCEVARHLARMNGSLIELGHPGFHVTASDPDVIGSENIFRQPYTKNEIGMNKAVQLITRINRSFGTQWKTEYINWDNALIPRSGISRIDRSYGFNVLITCVDNVEIRQKISHIFKHTSGVSGRHNESMLWMDFGNGYDFGQVVLSDFLFEKHNQFYKPRKYANVIDIYPDAMDLPEEVSCSLAVSLGRQDLFINSLVADLGMRLLWSIFRRALIPYNSIFINLKTNEFLFKTIECDSKKAKKEYQVLLKKYDMEHLMLGQ
jgi:PRTRC genetic system ThiF family protein